MLEDRYGLPLSITSAAARDAYVVGVDAILSATGDALGPLNKALELEPGFALALSAKARFLQVSGDARGAREAGAQAMDMAASASDRERSHANIFNLLTSGRGPDALALTREHVAQFPRDGFALSPSCSVFGLIGFSGRAGREPEQLELLEPLVQHYGDDWWFLTVYAFALVELGQWQRGRELVERALAANPDSAHTAHVLAHALYEGGEDRACADYLAKWLPGYSNDGKMACHIWWHLCLVKLMLGERDDLWDVYDAHCAPAISSSPAINVFTDGVALMWRAELAGMPRDESRWQALAQFREKMFPKPMVFVDSHGALPPLALGNDAAFSEWLEQLREAAANNKLTAGTVPSELAEAFAAFERGNHGEVIRVLEPVMAEVVRIGGSRAQRDLVQNTLLSAYIKDGRPEAARAFIKAQEDRAQTVPVDGYAH